MDQAICNPRVAVSRRIVRSTGVLAGATGLSRVLGFIRDILTATLYGASVQAEAFVVAFRLPNLLRDLVAEGAVASAVVPGLGRQRATSEPERFWQVSQALLCKLGVGLGLIGLGGAIAAPQIVTVVAPGFMSDPEKFDLTVRLTRLLFPFITLVGLWAYFMGLLNTLGHFALPALGPAILNVAMIAACVWEGRDADRGIQVLAIGVLVGGVVQLAAQIPVAMRLGFRWAWRWADPEADRIVRMLGPRIVGSAVYQANVLIDTMLASWSSVVGTGAVACLYFANRLVQLPLAVIGTASAQASLPSLAEQSAAQDLRGMASTIRSVLRLVAFLVIPSAVGLVVLAGPVVVGLFERGAFDHRASLMTADALRFYALGLFAFSMNKVLTNGFYALHDTWTPVRLAVEVVIMNLVLSLILMWPMRIGGLALAAAITNSLNAYRLSRRLSQRLGEPLLQPLAGSLWRILGASAVMAAACTALWHAAGFAARPVLGLLVVIPAGVVVYGAACWALRVEELSKAIRWVSTILPSSSG
jgi:putative peptidoglycan lipid II flippase